MVDLMSLWLPIVASAVAVFIASFITWMVLPHHKPDFKGLPDESAMSALLNSANMKPGFYMFPFCAGSEEMKSEAFKERYKAGPHGNLTVLPGAPSMGKNLVLMIIFNLVVSFCVAYVGTLALTHASTFGEVLRVTGAVSVMIYVLGSIPNGIWFGKRPRHMLMDALDGIAYGLITGAFFAWLWPAAG